MSNIIHKRNIEKGNFGEFSKIEEEFQELKDANEQHCKILEICEICDLIGAIDGYAKKKYNLKNEGFIFRTYNITKIKDIRFIEPWQWQYIPFLKYKQSVKESILTMI